MVMRVRAPTFVELFTPKLITILREGYSFAGLKADAIAGLTVAIVALPLSMAIAIASGVAPERGLYTAIIGGFIVSAAGGSRFQIGGPAGAFIVLVAATVVQHGVDGLILATILSGFILVAAGFFRLGTFVKYIPYPVTVGFTAGIATIIFASQLKDLLGLSLAAPEPGPFVPKLQALAAALPAINYAALAIAALAIAIIGSVRRFRPQWPAYLIAVVLCATIAWLVPIPIETIGTRFGEIPRALPAPHLPPISFDLVVRLIPAAFSFALLGSIESLLSAVVADSMTGRRHRSNCELVAQGVANIASALFGGICVTGTIARTATNVRAGARGPVSGMLHSIFLMLFILIAAPLASFIPLSVLAAVLCVVAWTMAEKHEFATLLRASGGDAAVLMATFGLVVFRDLMVGILVGFGIGALLFIHRMARAVEIDRPRPLVQHDLADTRTGELRTQYEPSIATDRDILVFRISGAFFFGAAAAVGAVLDELGEQPKVYVIDFSGVPLLDSTAATTIAGFARKARRKGASIIFAGVKEPICRTLVAHAVGPPDVMYSPNLEDALALARSTINA